MTKEKLAILTDSGTDVSSQISEDLFVLPLLIQIDKKSYFDGVDINLEQVLELVDKHKITTSLPSANAILKTLDEIKTQGYTHVIVTTISSGLSGTYNFIRMLVEDYKGLKIALVDTKNISKASGYTIHLALDLIKKGKSFGEIVQSLNDSLANHKVFFTVGTVEYLRRGGRIGLVAGTVANILSIKPIITCNDAGVYYAVGKTRGYQKAINKMIQLAIDFIGEHQAYDLTILVAKVDEKTKENIAQIKDIFKKAVNFEITSVSPTLAIHTGPQALGIAIRKRN